MGRSRRQMLARDCLSPFQIASCRQSIDSVSQDFRHRAFDTARRCGDIGHGRTGAGSQNPRGDFEYRASGERLDAVGSSNRMIPAMSERASAPAPHFAGAPCATVTTVQAVTNSA
jgi:hypothetical protein